MSMISPSSICRPVLGGEKNSGIGRFNGSWAIEAFTTDQWLTAQHAPRGLPWNASAVQGPWS